MKLLKTMLVLFLASSLVLGQSTAGNNTSSEDRIANQIKTLQDAISSQQQQIEALRQELAAKKQADATPHLTNAALTTSMPGAADSIAARRVSGSAETSSRR